MKRIITKPFRNIETVIFIAIWLLVYCSPFLVMLSNSGEFEWRDITSSWLFYLPFLILSIINHYLLIPFLFFKSKAKYFLVVLGCLVVFPVILHNIRKSNIENLKMAREHMPVGTQHRPFPPGDNLNFPPPPLAREFDRNTGTPRPRAIGRFPLQRNIPPYMISVFISILIIGFDTGLRSFFKWIILEQKHFKLEKDKVLSELAFLKTQVSPHFLMNTLNNIHALIDVDTEEAKTVVIRLSKLMRHLLYDSNHNHISIEKEVEFIQSYIDLMKIRFSNKVDIKFVTDIDKPDIKLPPLLFTSVIENAFKYGISYQQDSFIYINLLVKGENLLFRISNSYIADKQGNTSKDGASGIGLENTRKRFDLLYGDNYTMDITTKNNTFNVNISLPL